MGLVKYAKGSKFHKEYFKKLFGRPPIEGDEFVYPIIDKAYAFQFDRWAEGKINYNMFSRRSKPAMMNWITKQIIKHFETI